MEVRAMNDSAEARHPNPGAREGLAFEALGRCLVTGGAGYLASHLSRVLLARGLRVRGIDLRRPAFDDPFYDFQQGDLRDPRILEKACDGVDTIFHTASIVDFAGFVSPKRRRRSVELNVDATRSLLAMAARAGVERFVYTSTSNVLIGRAVEGATGSTPYPDRFADLYSETKAAAEQMVLAANGTPNGRSGLQTCALRPGGIYGPNDPFYLPAMLEKCERGLLIARIGDGRALSDNTYLGNLLHGELLAARRLVPGARCAGRAYYVTDGEPLDRMAFFRPFIEAAGHRFPRFALPVAPMLAVAFGWEVLARYGLAPEPLLTRMQVLVLARSHSGSLAEARRDLGYDPLFDWRAARQACLPWSREVVRAMRAGEWPRRSPVELAWLGDHLERLGVEESPSTANAK